MRATLLWRRAREVSVLRSRVAVFLSSLATKWKDLVLGSLALALALGPVGVLVEADPGAGEVGGLRDVVVVVVVGARGLGDEVDGGVLEEE